MTYCTVVMATLAPSSPYMFHIKSRLTWIYFFDIVHLSCVWYLAGWKKLNVNNIYFRDIAATNGSDFKDDGCKFDFHLEKCGVEFRQSKTSWKQSALTLGSLCHAIYYMWY